MPLPAMERRRCGVTSANWEDSSPFPTIMRFSPAEQPGFGAKWGSLAVITFSFAHSLPLGLTVIVAAILSGCAPAPPPLEPSKIDPTQQAWYGDAVQRLEEMN